MENGFIFKRINENKNKNINIYKREKRFWGTFRIYQLISTANPALFEGPDLFVCFYLFQTQV